MEGWTQFNEHVYINLSRKSMKIDQWVCIPAGLIHHFMNAMAGAQYKVTGRIKGTCEGIPALMVINEAGESCIFEYEPIKQICSLGLNELPLQDMYLRGGGLYISNQDGSLGYIEQNLAGVFED